MVVLDLHSHLDRANKPIQAKNTFVLYNKYNLSDYTLFKNLD